MIWIISDSRLELFFLTTNSSDSHVSWAYPRLSTTSCNHGVKLRFDDSFIIQFQDKISFQTTFIRWEKDSNVTVRNLNEEISFQSIKFVP